MHVGLQWPAEAPLRRGMGPPPGGGLLCRLRALIAPRAPQPRSTINRQKTSERNPESRNHRRPRHDADHAEVRPGVRPQFIVGGGQPAAGRHRRRRPAPARDARVPHARAPPAAGVGLGVAAAAPAPRSRCRADTRPPRPATPTLTHAEPICTRILHLLAAPAPAAAPPSSSARPPSRRRAARQAHGGDHARRGAAAARAPRPPRPFHLFC